MENDRLINLVTQLKVELGDRDEEFDQQKNHRDTLEGLRCEIGSRDDRIAVLEAELASRDKTVNSLNLHIKHVDSASKESQRQISSLDSKISSLESILESQDASTQLLVKSLKEQLSSANSELESLRSVNTDAASSSSNPQLVNLQEKYPYQFLMYKTQCLQEIKAQHAVDISQLEAAISNRLEAHNSKQIQELNVKNTTIIDSITRDYENRMVVAREDGWNDCKREMMDDFRVKYAAAVDAITREYEQKMPGARKEGWADCEKEMHGLFDDLKAKHAQKLALLKDQYFEALEKVKGESLELHQRVLESGREYEERIRRMEEAGDEKMGALRNKYVLTLQKVKEDVRLIRKRHEGVLRDEYAKRRLVERELREMKREGLVRSQR